MYPPEPRSGRFTVLCVGAPNDVSEILDAIVMADPIQMVDLAAGPLAVMHEPYESVGACSLTACLDNDVAIVAQ